MKTNVHNGEYKLEQLAVGDIVLSGELDHNTVVEARQTGERWLAETTGTCRFSLKGLESAHSGVLSLLLCLIRYAERHQRSIVFADMPDRLYDMARMSGLDQLLPLERQEH